ncbi:hypothetical protein [Cronobacter phage Dev_CS701]|nr:hypothetical protein [Cronobacter phage Dev_CS701]
MIDKYYIIVTKDKDGFTIPHVENGKTPELFATPAEAKDKLDFIRKCYESKLNYVPDEPRFSFFRKTEQLPATEEQKKEMRWFIENSKIQGVLLKL